MKIESLAHRRPLQGGRVLRWPSAVARVLGQAARAWWSSDPRDEDAAMAPLGLAVVIAAMIIVGCAVAAAVAR